jgi:hypothetical protein
MAQLHARFREPIDAGDKFTAKALLSVNLMNLSLSSLCG